MFRVVWEADPYGKRFCENFVGDGFPHVPLHCNLMFVSVGQLYFKLHRAIFLNREQCHTSKL